MTRLALTAISTLLQNFLGLQDTTAADVMVPRADIVSVVCRWLDDIYTMSDANHSRVPVYRYLVML